MPIKCNPVGPTMKKIYHLLSLPANLENVKELVVQWSVAAFMIKAELHDPNLDYRWFDIAVSSMDEDKTIPKAFEAFRRTARYDRIASVSTFHLPPLL